MDYIEIVGGKSVICEKETRIRLVSSPVPVGNSVREYSRVNRGWRKRYLSRTSSSSGHAVFIKIVKYGILMLLLCFVAGRRVLPNMHIMY